MAIKLHYYLNLNEIINIRIFMLISNDNYYKFIFVVILLNFSLSMKIFTLTL